MADELVYEIAHRIGSAADAAVALAQSWALLKFNETGSTGSGAVTVELGVANPEVEREPAVRVWQRNGTTDHDAQIILAWLHENSVSDGLGVGTDMLVQLFIEAAVSRPHGRYSCDGEFLATLAGAAEYAGTTASSEWSLSLNLAPEVVEAALAAIADSDSRWRYAIVAARDPESPAGRVRQLLLADLGG